MDWRRHIEGGISNWVRWLVTVGLLILLALVVDLREVLRTVSSADPGLLGMAVVVALGDRLLMAGKWFPLLRIQLPDISLTRAIRAYFAASFAALLLPASVGGDVLRAVGLGTDRKAVIEVGASVAIERVLGLAGSGFFALLVLYVAWSADVAVGFLVPWAVACVGIGIGAVILPSIPAARSALDRFLPRLDTWKIASLLERFAAAYGAYRAHPRTLVGVGLLSAVEQIMPVLTFWAVAWALGLAISFEALFVAVPLTVFATRIPVAVAGIGILEGGLVYFLGLFGVPGAQALSLALVGRIVEFVALLPGAFWWADLSGDKASKRPDSPERGPAGTKM